MRYRKLKNSVSDKLKYKYYGKDLNNWVYETRYMSWLTPDNNYQNIPSVSYEWGVFVVLAQDTNNLVQIFFEHTYAAAKNIYVRVRYEGAWGIWKNISLN